MLDVLACANHVRLSFADSVVVHVFFCVKVFEFRNFSNYDHVHGSQQSLDVLLERLNFQENLHGSPLYNSTQSLGYDYLEQIKSNYQKQTHLLVFDISGLISPSSTSKIVGMYLTKSASLINRRL